MLPQSLGTITLSNTKTPAQKLAASGWVGRHAPYQKGAVLPETQVPCCPRVRVADLPEGFLKQNHIEAMEHNQLIASCCRHPENHEVEARKTHPDEKAPDIYIFYCTAKHPPFLQEIDGQIVDMSRPNNERAHRFLCVGATDDKRPYWDAA